MAQYLVLDIGGTFIKYAIMDDEASFVFQDKIAAAARRPCWLRLACWQPR